MMDTAVAMKIRAAREKPESVRCFIASLLQGEHLPPAELKIFDFDGLVRDLRNAVTPHQHLAGRHVVVPSTGLVRQECCHR